MIYHKYRAKEYNMLSINCVAVVVCIVLSKYLTNCVKNFDSSLKNSLEFGNDKAL